MKRMISLLLPTCMLLLALTGCPAPGSGNGSSSTTTPPVGSPTTPAGSGDPAGPNTPNEPTPTTSKIGGVEIQKFFVLYKEDGIESVAASLAADLSALAGVEIEYGTRSRNKNQIVLTAESDAPATTIGNTAHMKLDGTELTLSADNRNTLSLAASSLLAAVRANEDIAPGTDKDIALATTFYKASNTSLFKYCGYWMPTDPAHPDSMIAHWNTSYVEIAFSGNVITVQFDKESTFEARIDKGAYVSYSGVSEQTFFAEGAGTHVLRIYQNYNSSRIPHLPFSGVTAGEDVIVSRAPNKAHYVQFLGDSITDTPTAYAQQLADKLDYDFCVVARAGVALQSDKSFWAVDSILHYALLGEENLGMEDLFFKRGLPDAFLSIPEETRTMLFHALRAGYTADNISNLPLYYIGDYYKNGDAFKNYRNSLSAADKTKLDGMVETIRAGGKPTELLALENEYASFIEGWKSGAYDMDFENMSYKPDLVYIFLGTNDGISGGAGDPSYKSFVETYLSFVEKIKAVYGEDTGICVMNCLKLHEGVTDTSRYEAIDEIAAKLRAKYGSGIYAISSADTRQIIQSMTFPDGLHPDAASHKILADKLAPIVKTFFHK